jgi:hypothetical protein
VSTVHERLLAAMPLAIPGLPTRASEVNRTRDALRAVVERHKPVPCPFDECTTPGHRLCKACGGGHEYPEGCPDTMAIAEALGVEIEETP